MFLDSELVRDIKSLTKCGNGLPTTDDQAKETISLKALGYGLVWGMVTFLALVWVFNGILFQL